MAIDTAIDFQRWKRWPGSTDDTTGNIITNSVHELSTPQRSGNDAAEDSSDDDPNDAPVAAAPPQQTSMLSVYDQLENDESSDSD